MINERRRAFLQISIIDFCVLIFTVCFFVFFRPDKIVDGDKAFQCIVQRLFSIYCPACGGTRAVGYLLSFRFKEAFLSYPPLFVGIALLLWINFLYLKCIYKNNILYIRRHKYYEFLSLPIAILLTFIVRNTMLFLGFDYLGDILH